MTKSWARPNLEGIPDELKSLPQWVTWQARVRQPTPGSDRSATYAKLPRNPHTGGNADVSNRETWGTFDQACKSMHDRGHDGVGFVLTVADPYLAIDIDNCWNGDGWSPAAQAVLNQFHTYAEASVSGTGLHVLFRALEPAKKKEKIGGHELIFAGGYVTVTGDVASQCRTIEDCSEEFSAWRQGLHSESQGSRNQRTPAQPSPLSPPRATAAAELCDAHPGFCKLYREGNLGAYGGDHSAADLGMLTIAARAGMVEYSDLDQLLRASALMREKWNRPDYRDRTIQKALDSRGFDPRQASAIISSTTTEAELWQRVRQLEDAIAVRDRAAQVTTLCAAIKSNRSLSGVSDTAIALVRKFFAFEERGLQPPYTLTATEIAQATGRHRNTVSDHLNRLENAGLIARTLTWARPLASDRGPSSTPRTLSLITPLGSAKDFAGAVASVRLPKPTAKRVSRFTSGERPHQNGDGQTLVNPERSQATDEAA